MATDLDPTGTVTTNNHTPTRTAIGIAAAATTAVTMIAAGTTTTISDRAGAGDSVRGRRGRDDGLGRFSCADEFIFDDGASGVGAGIRDVISGDFQGAGVAGGDLIVLKGIDADTGVAGDQAFEFDPDNSFDSAGDLIRASNGAGGTVLQLHTDGDGVVDIEIEVAGVAPNALTAADIDL